MRRVVRIVVGAALAAAVLTGSGVLAVAAQAATAVEYGLL